jgi:hypothetical protein
MILFSKKCEILTEVSLTFQGEDGWDYFFEQFDLGLPLAAAIHHGGAEANAKGIEWIDEAWEGLCEMLNIDKYGEYPNMEEMMNFAISE